MKKIGQADNFICCFTSFWYPDASLDQTEHILAACDSLLAAPFSFGLPCIFPLSSHAFSLQDFPECLLRNLQKSKVFFLHCFTQINWKSRIKPATYVQACCTTSELPVVVILVRQNMMDDSSRIGNQSAAEKCYGVPRLLLLSDTVPFSTGAFLPEKILSY